MINLPIGDNFALRGVVYVDNQGGYIDNVAGTRDTVGLRAFPPRRHGARQRRAGFSEPGGLPVRRGSERRHLP
jgi:iron complex outermembrane receptor protein